MFPQSGGSLPLTKAAQADLWGTALLAKLPHPRLCYSHLPPLPALGLSLPAWPKDSSALWTLPRLL